MWCHDCTRWNHRDVAFEWGNKCIDSISISDGLIPCLEGHKVIDWEEIFNTDHRRHVIDLKLEFFRKACPNQIATTEQY